MQAFLVTSYDDGETVVAEGRDELRATVRRMLVFDGVQHSDDLTRWLTDALDSLDDPAEWTPDWKRDFEDGAITVQRIAASPAPLTEAE